MAVTFVSNALGGTATTTTFSITLPATQIGDIIILEYTHRNTTDGTIAGTYSGGAFAEVHDQLYATSAFSGKTLWSRATGNHAAQTVTGASLTNSCAAIITIYRGGLSTATPIAGFLGEQNASGNETQAQITTVHNAAWVVLVVANSPDFDVTLQSTTSPGALTERAEVLSTGGSDTAISHASLAKATAGATGAFTWSQGNAPSGSWAYYIIPEPDPTYTQAAFRMYEDGTEAGSTAIAAQDTNISRDVTSGNSNLQLRVRFQNSNGAAGFSTDDYQLQYEKNDSGTHLNINTGTLEATPFFNDTFTDTDATLITNHTPNTGTSWIRSTLIGTDSMWINTNQIKSDGTGGLSDGVLHTANVTYPAPDYTVQVTTVTGDADDDTNWLVARWQDASNMYAVRFNNTNSRLWTVVAGVWTAIGSLGAGTVDGSVVQLRIVGTTLSFIDDGATILSSTVTDHSVAGRGGVGIGNLAGNGDDISLQVLDSFSITQVLVPVASYNSASLTDGNATTNRLGAGTGAFVAGEISEDGLVDDFYHTASNYTEHLYSLTIRSASVANADTLDFRILRNDAITGITYTVTPRITIVKTSIYTQSLSATLSFTGSITKQINKSFTGVLSFIGTLIKQLSKILTGALSFVGNLIKLTTRTLTGVLSFSGNLTSSRLTFVALSGSMSFVGDLVRRISSSLTASLSFVGSLVKRASRSPTAVLSFISGSGSLKLTQRIEMNRLVSNTSGTANTYIEIPHISTRLNAGDFDGTVTYYFEAAIDQDGSVGQTAYAELWNKTDGVAVSGSEVSKTGLGFVERLRSGAITLSGDKIYTVRVKHSNTTPNTLIGGTRIIVVQEGNITKTQIHQELGVEGSTTSTSSSNILTGSGKFLYEAAKYNGTVTVRHDAIINTTASNTTTSGIYDVTAVSVVTGSEVSKNNDTSYTLLSSGNITLIDGNVYSPTSYVSAGTAVTFASSKLVFTITGSFTKFLAYMSARQGSVSGSANNTSLHPDYNVNVDYVTAFNPTDFSGVSLNTYYESVLSINNAAQTAYSNLQDYDYLGVSVTDITGSETSHTGDTNIVRKRSSSFNMPTGLNDLLTGVSASLGTNAARHYNSYIILEVVVANSLTKRTYRSVGGSLSFVGSLAKRTSKSFLGGLSFVGSLATVFIPGATTFTQNLAGALSFVGSVSKKTNTNLSSGLTFLGSLTKAIARLLTANLSFVGNFTKSIARSVTAVLSFSGSLAQRLIFVRAFTGALSFTGAMTKRTSKSLSGGLSFIGTISKAISRVFSSALSFIGSLVRRSNRAMTASVSFIGSLLTGSFYSRALTGTLSFVGSISKRTNKGLSGSVSFIGVISKSISKAIGSNLSFVGSITKLTITVAKTAILSFTGSISKRTGKNLTGSLSFIGSITKVIRKNLTATLSFIGSLTKRLTRALTGVLSFVGTLTTTLPTNIYFMALNASLSFSGAISKRTSKTMSSALSFVGLLTTSIAPKFVRIITSVSSSLASIIKSSKSNIATAKSSDKLSSVSSSSNKANVKSNNKDRTISSSSKDIEL